MGTADEGSGGATQAAWHLLAQANLVEDVLRGVGRKMPQAHVAKGET